MYSVGDVVCYPMHGIGKIESIKKSSALGELSDYYVLRFEEGRIVTMVPVAGAEELGLRYVLSADECRNAIDYISLASPINLSSDWEKRRQYITSQLNSGDPLKTIDIIITLSTRSGYRGLSTGEHRILDASIKTLVSELTYVLSIDESVITKLIDTRIDSIRKSL